MRANPSSDSGAALTGTDPRPLWLRLVLSLLPLAGGIPLLLSSAYVVQLIGTTLVCVGLYQLVPEGGRQLRRLPAHGAGGWLSEALPIIAVIALAAGLLWPSLLGMMVQSQDHTIHLARAWHFVHQMLAKGQLSGWSDIWFAGYPAGEDYPPLGDYLISSVYLGTFGLLGWEASYGIALLLMYAIAALGVYACGRTYLGRMPGLFGALFFLLDRGQYREGGWNYTIWWGVWPQVLCTGLAFFAFAALDKVIRRGRARDFALTGLCVGLALLAHPVAVMYFALGLPIFVVLRALSGNEPAGRVVVRSLGAFVLGGCLAAYWSLPFIAKSGWMAKYGELWKPLSAMASGMWQGTLFDNAMPPVIILGIFGAAVGLWRRNFGATFLAAYGLVTLFMASSTSFKRLDLLTISPAFGQVQFQRLAILAKPTVWLLAGYALAMLFQRTQKPPPRAFCWRRYALVSLLLLACAPFVKPLIVHYSGTYGRELGNPKTRRDVPHYADYRRFLDWSAQLKQREQGFYRIAYVRPYNDHYFGAATAYNATPMYKVGYTPAINFIHKPDDANPDIYRLLNVKYVVGIGEQHMRGLELLQRFGAITVYRFNEYTEQRFTLQGTGKVTVQHFDPAGTGIRLRIRDAAADARLILHVANYPNWRATIDGKAVPITTASLANYPIFISVPARNGTLELHYGWPAVNVFGSLLSWLAVLALLGMVLVRYRPNLGLKTRALLARWTTRAERYGVVLGITVLLLPLAVLAVKARKQRPVAEGVSLIERLDQATVSVERGGQNTVCRRRGRRHECSERERWNYVGPTTERVGDALRRCIWAHPVDRGLLRIDFGQVKLGRAIVGYHGLTDQAARTPSGTPVKLRIWLDGHPVHEELRSNTRGWVHWEYSTAGRQGQQADLSFTVESARSGVRHYCFEGAIND